MFKFLYRILLALALFNTITNFAMDRDGGNFNELSLQNTGNMPTEGLVGEEALEGDGYDSDTERMLEESRQRSKAKEARMQKLWQELSELRQKNDKEEAELNFNSDHRQTESSASAGDDLSDFENDQQGRNYRHRVKYRANKKKNSAGAQIISNESLCWSVGILSFLIYCGYRYFTFTDEYDQADD